MSSWLLFLLLYVMDGIIIIWYPSNKHKPSNCGPTDGWVSVVYLVQQLTLPATHVFVVIPQAVNIIAQILGNYIHAEYD